MCYLSDACVLLQLAESGFVPADEVFKCGIVLNTELSPGELHATLQVLHIRQNVLQTHCTQVGTHS